LSLLITLEVRPAYKEIENLAFKGGDFEENLNIKSLNVLRDVPSQEDVDALMGGMGWGSSEFPNRQMRGKA